MRGVRQRAVTRGSATAPRAAPEEPKPPGRGSSCVGGEKAGRRCGAARPCNRGRDPSGGAGTGVVLRALAARGTLAL